VETFLLIGKIFLFSSRRRHTRFSRDWSSDVCSSDLQRSMALLQTPQLLLRMAPLVELSTPLDRDHARLAHPVGPRPHALLPDQKIGRASCRERVYMMVACDPTKTKQRNK